MMINSAKQKNSLLEDMIVAIEHHDIVNPSESIITVLLRTAPKTVDYWIKAAEELHCRNLHYDALDCWKQAMLYECEGEVVDREGLAFTLWNISEGKDIFADEALALYESLNMWDMVAHIRYRLYLSKKEVLTAIKYAIDASLEGYVDWNKVGVMGPYEEVFDWMTLGEKWLSLECVAEALYAFYRAVDSSSGNLEIIHSISDEILQYVSKHR